MSAVQPFHLAIVVDDLEAARAFYGGTLGCAEGRSADNWVDFNLFGHQVVAYVLPGVSPRQHQNPVDGHDVPVPHFGVILAWDDFDPLAERLRADGVEFVIEPIVRWADQPGEQATMYVLDPAGNVLEFKAFRDIDNLFAKNLFDT